MQPLLDLFHQEKVGLRGMERELGPDGGRVLLVAVLPPRYQAEHLIELLASLDGVREVEWDG